MVLQAPRDIRWRWFLVIAAVVYVGNLVISPLYRTHAGLAVPEWVVGVDLLLVVPLVYLILCRPAPKQALLSVLALLSLGVLVGSFAIPDDDKLAWRTLEDLRWVGLGLLVLAQIALIAMVLRDILAHGQAANLESAIDGAIARRVHDSTVRALLQADARVWTYALVRDASRFRTTAPAFHSARHDGNASNQQAFLILVAIEIPIMHGIVHLFSPIVAIWLTALSLYGLVFLWAEYRATVLRATTLEYSVLHIRHGVLGDLTVPYDRIDAVEPTRGRPGRRKGHLRFVGTGTANVRLRLAPGTRLPTLLGMRAVDEIHIGLDEPDRFINALAARLELQGNATARGIGGAASIG
jgi:membrane protein YdbS with pleckstrin-like domain